MDKLDTVFTYVSLEMCVNPAVRSEGWLMCLCPNLQKTLQYL
jgi:hypothetical protein